MIDDDVKLTALVVEYLAREGMEVEVCHDGGQGLERARAKAPSRPILDVMLPGLSGLDVLRQLRSGGDAAARLPVLMLTARGDELDKVLGLELGADDYLPKPFSSRELAARLRALLRRSHLEAAPAAVQEKGRLLRVGDIEIDPAARQAQRGAEILTLTSGEFDMLELLLRHAGEVVTRETISEKALGRRLLPQDRSIDVHMSNLRRKLGATSTGQERIKAVRGIGYLYAKPAVGERKKERE
jgi:two-component system response regulator CpxR